MRRDDAIARLQHNAKAIRALGAGSLYLYGSTARDAASPASDIDIFIDRNPSQKFGLLELTNLEFLLADIMGQSVDLSTRSALHPALRAEIESSSVKVF